MKPDTAHQAKTLIEQIDSVTALLVRVDLAITETWPITMLRATAPDGSSVPAGTTVDLLPEGVATPDNWKQSISTARNAYQAQLDGLNSQLAAL